MAATPTILDLVSIHWFSDQCLGRLVWFFGGSLGVNWMRKVPFDDRSSNMAAMAAILDLVSVNYLTNACRLVRFFGASIFTLFHFSLNLIVHTPTDNVPIGGICHALCCPCLFLLGWNCYQKWIHPATCFQTANSNRMPSQSQSFVTVENVE
jgi:hypothetical protein